MLHHVSLSQKRVSPTLPLRQFQCWSWLTMTLPGPFKVRWQAQPFSPSLSTPGHQQCAVHHSVLVDEQSLHHSVLIDEQSLQLFNTLHFLRCKLLWWLLCPSVYLRCHFSSPLSFQHHTSLSSITPAFPASRQPFQHHASLSSIIPAFPAQSINSSHQTRMLGIATGQSNFHFLCSLNLWETFQLQAWLTSGSNQADAPHIMPCSTHPKDVSSTLSIDNVTAGTGLCSLSRNKRSM